MANDRALEFSTNHRTLEVYKKANSFTLKTIKMSDSIPKHMLRSNREHIQNQIFRSSTSITANMVEGCSCGYLNSMIHQFNIAAGSCTETIQWIQTLHGLGYINDEVCTELISEGEEVLKLTYGYLKYLKRKNLN